MVETALLVGTQIGVRAEAVPLGLNQVGPYVCPAKRVQIRQSIGHGRQRKTAFDSLCYDFSQAALIFLYSLPEKFMEQKVFQVWILLKCSGDIIQEHGLDDAAGTEDGRDIPKFKVALILFEASLSREKPWA